MDKNPNCLAKLYRYKCTECDKAYRIKSQLNDHMNKHRGEKPFKCNDCDFQTSSSSSIIAHNRIHLREKGIERTVNDSLLFHKCNICGNDYKSSTSLKEHIQRIHEGKTPQYKCNMCDETFISRATMRRHKGRVHPSNPDLKCKLCGHICADGYAFKLHENVHREGRFMCKYCGKCVKSQQTLDEHERTHTGENPYLCAECDYRCKSSSVLNKHRISKHGLQKKGRNEFDQVV